MSQQGSDVEVQEQDSQFYQEQDFFGGQDYIHIYNQEQHFDQYDQPKQQQEQDLDLSFERDINLLTKVKAKIMFNINKQRQLQQLPIFYQDITLSNIAMQYAASIKDINTSSKDISSNKDAIDKNQLYLKTLSQQARNEADYKICQMIVKYQQDVPVKKEYQQRFFIESSYLFFQMDKQRQLLMDSNNTNIGIGLAGNDTKIAIVLFVTQRQLTILEINQNPHSNQIQVRGKMLQYSVGIYGVKINNAPGGDYKQIANALYDKIDFNRQTKEFCIYLDIQPNWKQRRWIELWTRQNPDAIGYRKPRKQKQKGKGSNFRLLKMKMRSLFVLYPQKKYIQCYNDEVQAQQNRNLNLSNMILQSSLKQQEVQPQKKSQVQSQKSKEEDDDEQIDQQAQDAKEQTLKQNMTSNKQIKQQLQQAISQAKNTYDGLYDNNRLMQAKIKQMRQKNHIFIDKTNEASMNQHKYLNILAQVHQTRVQLSQTQARYNKMSLQLQNKLSQKQSKCNDIRTAFQQLKRQVSKKATYSRSQQPIKAQKIQQWEDRQGKVTEELQNLRLQILRARNTLAKNQKILKKKQQLAEGLHLIDFEQLKIQNQTLNQKIQERNQDLHKLKKKTTTMVQILTHTREKLVFVQKKKQSLMTEVSGLDTKIQGLRGKINRAKQQCQTLRLQIQDAKQQTQIVNSQQLVVDFKKRAQNILKIEQQIKLAIEKQKDMKTIIQMYQRKIRKQGLIK